jgi:glutathione synthase/RimK-type ligase-like ATP-grasp enzyme
MNILTNKVGMIVGIHPDHNRELSGFVKRYETILSFNNIETQFLHISDKDFFEKVKKLDAFIFRWFHYDYDRQLARIILPLIRDTLNIPTFPDNNTDWHFDDKIRQYYLMKLNGFPMTESWIFWDRQDALDWAEKASYPVVFKLKGGAGSQNVILVKDKTRSRSLIYRMFGKGIKDIGLTDRDSTTMNDFRPVNYAKLLYWKLKKKLKGESVETFYEKQKNYILFQKFLPGNEYDTRVTVIGERAFAFRRFNRPGDFRSSGSGLIDHDHNKIDPAFVEMAFNVSSKLHFQSMAYDFLYNESRNPEFCEISYSYLDTAVFGCNGFWDRQMNWHEGHYWPQFCQLQDLLNLPDLRQPEIS